VEVEVVLYRRPVRSLPTAIHFKRRADAGARAFAAVAASA
jgi:hypothetical protein